MADSKYSVVSHRVDELLAPDPARFEVPPFQRPYSWGADEINQLIDDLFVNSSDSDLPYFLGSIVLAAATDDGRDTGRDLILDGQQRLTTISLLIAVLLHKLSENGGDDRLVGRYETRLFSFRGGAQHQPKIRLLNEDQHLYSVLLKEPYRCGERKHSRTQLGAGVGKMYSALEQYAAQAESKSVEFTLYYDMLTRLLEDVEIVKITAPSEKEAFRLFETLNDRGLALSAADLIKNKLFSQSDDIDGVMGLWSDLVSLTADDDVVNFLRYYWIATHRFTRKQRLYDEYRNHIGKLDPSAASDLALDLYYAAEDYEQIINPRPQTNNSRDIVISEGLERLNEYRAKSYRPVILACSRYNRDADKAKLLDICESITVRYSIVGERNPGRLELIYSHMCEALRDPARRPLEEMFAVDPLSSYMAEIPPDEEFKERLRNFEVTRVSQAWRQVLIRINAKHSSGEMKPEGSHRVHVDHILPQNPNQDVLLESRVTKEDALRLVPKIGNLTLLKGTWNQKASNKTFTQKKMQYYSASEFAITRQLLDHDRWGPDEVDARTRYFAEEAVKIYPHPLDIIS